MLFKRFLFVVILISVAFQSIGQNIVGDFTIDSSLDDMLSTYASEIEHCAVDELVITSLTDLQNICKGLLSSGICDDVDREYLINCDNLDENNVNYTPEMEIPELTYGSWAKACGWGALEGSQKVGYTIMFLPGLILAGIADAAKENEPSTALLDYTKSSWNNTVDEAYRLVSEEGGNPLEAVWDASVANPYLEQEKEYGCLNRKGQLKAQCDFYTIAAASAIASLATGKRAGATAGAAVGGVTAGATYGSVGGPAGAIVGATVGAGAAVTLRYIAKLGMRSVMRGGGAQRAAARRAARRAAKKERRDEARRASAERKADTKRASADRKAQAKREDADRKAQERREAAERKAADKEAAAKRKAENKEAAAKRKAENKKAQEDTPPDNTATDITGD